MTFEKKIKVVMSGGGTLGPVTPLLAISEIIKEKYPDTEFIWVGTKHGPEGELVERNNIRYISFSSGKLRRYFSILNIIDFFRIIFGFLESLVFLFREKPDLCVSAGGFVSVPLHWAAKFTKTPTWIHQQDVKVGLANKLMAPSASVITVALEKNVDNFPKGKTVWLGNPVRQKIFNGSKQKAKEIFGLSGERLVVFVIGGGTGSENVNGLVADSVQYLKYVCEIIHLSGKEREHGRLQEIEAKYSHYKTYEFFTDEMGHAYAVADLVISRGGFGTLTELSALKKPAIIIPIPGHQEENVALLSKSGAVVLLDERTGNGAKLATLVKSILNDKEGMMSMSEKLSKLIVVAKKDDILRVFEDALDK
ncbi:MAG: UDP-N-acetylglucosamine--N-acetylmuramyl-(pentapeptide) pyrophosphoryl-undecaprenol N-acetylglucosamine transferase [bacterium]|nr:UDP-N-acetylglucosamine--N-acetylmuramyl-(pentapeptide) pyrophosphoryl-undecaprenol N-acetylglucosamine transferase [bacterium]